MSRAVPGCIAVWWHQGDIGTFMSSVHHQYTVFLREYLVSSWSWTIWCYSVMKNTWKCNNTDVERGSDWCLVLVPRHTPACFSYKSTFFLIFFTFTGQTLKSSSQCIGLMYVCVLNWWAKHYIYYHGPKYLKYLLLHCKFGMSTCKYCHRTLCLLMALW